MDRRRLLGGAASLALLAMVAPWPWRGAAAQPVVKERLLGDPDAPVTIIEYSSLTCPHCAAFHTDTLPAIKERYIETGKAKIIYRDFPLDQHALNAAVIAHCAGEGRYFAFLEAMFASQPRWARSADPREALIQLAGLGGMPREQAEACLADDAMLDAVLQMRLDGQAEYDVSSTPTFVINGRVVAGNRSVDEFATVIEAALP